MARQSKSKIRGANLPMPQNSGEAADAIREIGELQRGVARIEADMNDEIARAKAQGESMASGLTGAITGLTEGLRIFCEANRAKLTDGGKTKSHEFGTGKIEWRLRPPAVRLKPGMKTEDIIAWCEARPRGDYTGFVRIKKELNKEAILASPLKAAAVPGIALSSAGEDFSVTPFEAQIEGGKA